MKRLFCAIVLFALSASVGGAAVPAKPHLNVAPPGQVMQTIAAYLNGDAMHSMWYVVASRTLAGKNMGKVPVYQWYLSFYAPDGEDGGKLVYQLPDKQGTLLSRVQRAHEAQMYFPLQEVKIVGTGQFEHPDVDDVVVWDHQGAADCGFSDVTVFGADSKQQVVQRIHVENGCNLTAKIVKRDGASAILLTGPYYASNAPMCCPTKPKASAMLVYKNGDWKMTPKYYTISASLAAHR
jgi:hypothetical protein